MWWEEVNDLETPWQEYNKVLITVEVELAF